MSAASTILLPFQPVSLSTAQWAAVSFLARYSGRTHGMYTAQVKRWFAWSERDGLDPLIGIPVGDPPQGVRSSSRVPGRGTGSQLGTHRDPAGSPMRIKGCATLPGLGIDLALFGMTKYDRVMAVERLTVSMESELAADIREAADSDEQNVSAWLADAARRRLANRGLRDVVAAWEREHGALSDEELASARALIDG